MQKNQGDGKSAEKDTQKLSCLTVTGPEEGVRTWMEMFCRAHVFSDRLVCFIYLLMAEWAGGCEYKTIGFITLLYIFFWVLTRIFALNRFQIVGVLGKKLRECNPWNTVFEASNSSKIHIQVSLSWHLLWLLCELLTIKGPWYWHCQRCWHWVLLLRICIKS